MNEKKLHDNKESELFRKATRDVKPLHQDKHPLTHRKKHRPQKVIEPSPSKATWIAESYESDWLSPEDSIHFAKSGIQHKILQRLKRGNVPIEAKIDLHHQTTDEAMSSVTRFINDCIAQGKRWVCIIHGKGYLSANQKPILKNFLNHWLRKQPLVLAFHSAQPQHGGTGAIYVLLKRKERI